MISYAECRAVLVIFLTFGFSDLIAAQITIGAPSSDGNIVQQEIGQPFSDSTGFSTHLISVHDINSLRSAMQGRSPLDLAILDVPTLERACEEGLLEEIVSSRLDVAPDGSSVGSDFLTGALHECGVAHAAYYHSVLASDINFRTDAAHLAFFDIERYPGRRALPPSPKGVLEFALIADGVDLDNVYSVLGTNDGVERAFAKLNSIRDEVVFPYLDVVSIDMVVEREVAMAFLAMRRPSLLQGREGEIFALDMPILRDMTYYAIPTTKRSFEEVYDFINFATEPSRIDVLHQADPVYGITRLSGISMLDVLDVAESLTCAVGSCPCRGTNICKESCCDSISMVHTVEDGLQIDHNFWSEKISLVERYEEWIGF